MFNPDATASIINGILQKADPALTVLFVPADDESVDDEFEVLRCGEKTLVSIQMGPGYVGTNRYFLDGAGELEAMQSLYMGVNVRAAATAAAAAL